MKIILLKDVPKVGKRYDIKEVSPGFARNVLFSKGLAEMATDKALSKLIEKKSKLSDEEKIHNELLAKAVSSIDGITVKFLEPANDQGHLFGSIHKEAIALLISQEHRVDIPAEAIKLADTIKTTGDHPVMIALGDSTASIIVSVEKR